MFHCSKADILWFCCINVLEYTEFVSFFMFWFIELMHDEQQIKEIKQHFGFTDGCLQMEAP